MKQNALPNMQYHDSPDIEIYQVIGKRSEQQDRYVVNRVHDGFLIAVMDGHNGVNTANYIAANITQIFTEARNKWIKKQEYYDSYGLPNSAEHEAIKQTFEQLNQDTLKFPSGSTLTLAFIQFVTLRKGLKFVLRAHVGQQGDSIFALSSAKDRLAIAPIHSVKENNKDVERIRINFKKETGANLKISADQNYIFSGIPGNGLALTRTLGDHPFTLIRKPEIKTYESAPKDTIILLASDGVCSSEEPIKPQINQTIKQLRNGNTLKEYGSSLRKVHDNLTMISLRFSETL